MAIVMGVIHRAIALAGMIIIVADNSNSTQWIPSGRAKKGVEPDAINLPNTAIAERGVGGNSTSSGPSVAF